GLVIHDGHVGGDLHGDSPAGAQAGNNIVLDLVSANQRPSAAPIANAESAVIVGGGSGDDIAVAPPRDEDPHGITPKLVSTNCVVGGSQLQQHTASVSEGPRG